MVKSRLTQWLMVTSKQTWALILILIVAAVLRLSQVGASEFQFDEANVLNIAASIADGRALPSAGHWTSIGIRNTPLLSYLWALPILISRNPSLIVGLSALLDTLAILLTYKFVAKFFSIQAGLAAALLFATGPWAIHWSRRVAPQNLPIITILLLTFLYFLVIQRRSWAVVPFMIALGLGFQTQIKTAFYGPAVILTLLIYRDRLRWRPLLVGLSLLALLVIPYGIYILGSWGEIWSALSRNVLKNPSALDGRALQYWLWIVSGAHLEDGLGAAAHLYSPYAQLLGGVTIFVGLLTLLGLGVALSKAIRWPKTHENYVLLLIWSVTPFLPLVWHSAPIYLSYLTNLFPLPFIWCGIGAAAALSQGRRLVSYAVAAGLLASLVVQAASVSVFYGYLNRYGTLGGYGRPLGHWLAIADGARKQAARAGLTELAVIAPGTAPASEGPPATLSYLLNRSLDLYFLGRGDTRSVLLSSERNRLYLVMKGDGEVRRFLGALGESKGDLVLADGLVVSFFVLSAHPLDHWLALPSETLDVRLENGVVFEGYDLPAEVRLGDRLQIVTYWRFDTVNARDRQGYWQGFAHFVDGSGKRWSQQDAFGLDSNRWRNGDILVQWYEMGVPTDAPPGDYRIHLGLYSLWDGHRAAILDASGQKAGDHIALGPVKVGK